MPLIGGPGCFVMFGVLSGEEAAYPATVNPRYDDA
jgi:hypothetical protein